MDGVCRTCDCSIMSRSSNPEENLEVFDFSFKEGGGQANMDYMDHSDIS